MSSAPNGKRRPLDAYMTQQPLADALVGVLPILPGCTVIEPHVGGGAFVRALRSHGHAGRVYANDINPEAAGLSEPLVVPINRDFLGLDPAQINRPWIQWVIGNPPFRGFDEHIDHALEFAPNVVFLLRLAAMESGRRAPCWQRWPLKKVWVLAERPSFTGGGTDSAAYGWFWFSREHQGSATVVPGWSWK